MMLYGIKQDDTFKAPKGETPTIFFDGSPVHLIESPMDTSLDNISEFVFERNSDETPWTLVKAIPGTTQKIIKVMNSEGYSVQTLLLG